MLSTLEVDIRPGSGIGMFELGSSLWAVLTMLRSLQHLFPQVEVKFDAENASTTPVILHLRPHFDLLFSGYHQHLHTICLRKITDLHPPIILRYKDSVICSGGDPLVKVQITRAFGPTYPGDELRYPGVWFSFEDDAINESLKGGMPHTGPDQRSKEVKRIIVTQKETQSGEHDALDEVIPCPVMFGDISRAIIKIHHGIVLHFFAPSSSPLHICLGETTAQDLNIDLGPPSRVYYKEDGRMAIHSPNPQLDEGQVRKIILHSNVPGSPLFQHYKRCPWELEGRPEDDEDDTPPRMRLSDKFEAISHFLSPRDPPPQSMVLDRTDDDDTITLPSPVSRLYGYSGVILEVNEASQVVTVTLF
ncbi:hypothetical protein F5J12DRAFT_791414 [Pisolithus orientalis]|uniref:uncharacterized protein n=1 Tax=Pisolithus orientalis TaxID=936130 RepID=UPI0022244903|nr:uncharacterized protein F5J12DRAFT_791414 [Pisolithus orientalis]KAI6035155.1 hypothetical protein F5J12DRAFT_791414 [Pisolithus orientalis]